MIDRNEIESIACSVHTHEILRNICIPEARAKNPDGSDCDYAKSPALTEPIADRAQWWSVRGIERHPDEFYPFYYAVARITRPRVVAEIGVWWGYALMAMTTGRLYPHASNLTLDEDTKIHHVYGFDNESYPGAEHCLDWCGKAFDAIGVSNTMVHCDSRQFDAGGLPSMQPVDLFSVDGDHNYQAAYRDLVLAGRVMNTENPLAAIVVDDVGWALNVRDAVEDFCIKYGWQAMYMPSLKGSALIMRLP